MSSKHVEGFPSVGHFFSFFFSFFFVVAAFAPELALRRPKALESEPRAIKFNSRHFFFYHYFFFAVLLLSVNMLICSKLSSSTPNSISSQEKEEDANFGIFSEGGGGRGLCLVTEIILVFPPD